MEQRFSNNSLDLQTLREFCEREGEADFYRKGDQMAMKMNGDITIDPEFTKGTRFIITLEA